MTRIQLREAILEELQHKINRVLDDISSAQLALGEESKSSAGDKYETSREMMQQEINKLGQQLIDQRKFAHLVSQLHDTGKEHIESGSFVDTPNGTYLIGIPFGKLVLNELDNRTVMGISVAAPLAAQLIGKSAPNEVVFNAQKLSISLVY